MAGVVTALGLPPPPVHSILVRGQFSELLSFSSSRYLTAHGGTPQPKSSQRLRYTVHHASPVPSPAPSSPTTTEAT